MKQLDKSTLNYIATEYLSTGRKVAAIRYVREVTGAGLAEAKDMVDKMSAEYETKGTLSGLYTYAEDTVYGAVDGKAVEEQVVRNYSKDTLIPAIKYYREATGVGLAEAKTAVERLLGATYVPANSGTPNPGAANPQVKKADSDRNWKIGTGVFIIILGLVVVGFALYLFIMVPKKKEESIADRVNAISADHKAWLLKNGYTEYVTDGNYLGYDAWYDTTIDNNRLFVYEPANEEDGYLGLLYDDQPKYPGEYCTGIAIYYNGETKSDAVEVRDGTVYENVTIVNSDDIEVYGVASWKPRVEVNKAKKEAMAISIPLGLWGLYMGIMGVVTVRRQRRQK